MNTPAFAKYIAALPGLLLLAACQVTTFETAPLTAIDGCDPALVARWDAFDADAPAGKPAEMSVQVDARCHIRLFDEHNPQGSDPTPLHLGRHGDATYAWFDAGWAMRVGREDHAFPEGDVVLMRYRLDGDTLQAWSTDDKAIAHAIVDGTLTGEVSVANSEIYNRLTGTQDPAVLARSDFFDAEGGTFRRAAGN
jgi:hypothetical protein